MRSRPITRWVAFSVLLALAGCSKTGAPNSSSSTPASPDAANTANSSSGLNSTAAPASSAPAEQAPAPAPKPPVVVESGTVLTVTVDQPISTNNNSAGDHFAASLAEPVTIDGTELLPAGTKASGTITQAQSAGHLKGSAVLALTLDSLTIHGRKYSIETNSFEEQGKGRGKRTGVGAGGGAAFGAIVGALAGGGKGAAIGALAGGGAGTAGTAFTGKRDFTIPAETRLHFKLVKSLKFQR